jgi:hypothetical protein
MFDYNTMRYVHLDFHTPGFVNVGEKFDAKEFGNTLKEARVNTIAVFALCHHGYTYFPSEIGVQHPRLQCDLLGGMSEELRTRGVQNIVYFSQNVNETLSASRPECVAINAEGKPVNSQILLSGDELYWTWLCPNRGDWIDSYFLPLIRETLEKYPADGIFIDMAGYLPQSCYCESCKAKMKAEGLDINDPDEHSDFLCRTNQEVARKVRRLLDEIKPGMRFLEGAFNRLGDADLAKGVLSEFYLETLPVQCGWFRFPFLARYFRNIGLPVLGMTGRFLKNWGDFGTLKTAHQLKVEVGAHLTAGLPSAVGDHMNCNGQLNKAVYKVIGEAFKFLEERQHYCVGGKPEKEIIIPLPRRLSANSATLAKQAKSSFNPMTATIGLSKMLTELHYQWDISSPDTDYNDYGAIILNHSSCEREDLQQIIDAVKNGALLIACHEGLKAKTPEATSELQEFLSISSLELLEDPGCFYQVKASELNSDIPDMPIYTHTRTYRMELDTEMTTLSDLLLSPVVRSREAFYGHFHGIPDKHAGSAVAVKKVGKGHVLVISPSLFFSYMQTGHVHHLNLVRNILERYYPRERRRLKSDAPGIVELALSRKDGNIVLQAVPFVVGRRHTDSFETLNDPVAIHGVNVAVKPGFTPSQIVDPINKVDIDFNKHGDWIHFELPAFDEHFVALLKP